MNNSRESRAEGASGHMHYRDVLPLLRDGRSIAWPFGGAPGSAKLYAEMKAGDDLVLWMGDGAHRDWGVLGGERPYKDGHVVVVDKPSAMVFVGQPVFVLTDSTGARWGRIQSLQVDNVDVEKVDVGASAPNGVRVRLDFRFPNKVGAKLVALAAEDDLVWRPA